MISIKKILFPLIVLGLLAAAPPAWAQGTRVQIAVDSGGSSTRVVLTHGSRVAYEVRSTTDGLEVRYSAPIRLNTAEQQVGDPILDRFELRDGRRILLQAGPGYRSYETFELRNPFRLVIDLQGNRDVRGAVEPAITLPERPGAGKTIVVLDPGHGGSESGATGPSGLREKEITLDLARGLKQFLGREGGLHVVLTRDEDRAIGLDERTAIANHNRADLFVSIHVNSSPRSSATGAETYFLSSDATDGEARTLAALENQRRPACRAKSQLFAHRGRRATRSRSGALGSGAEPVPGGEQQARRVDAAPAQRR